MEQRLSLVTLGVSDLARSRAFYEQLGWRSAVQPAEGIAFFQIGGMILSLYPRHDLAADAEATATVGSGFRGFTLGYNTRSRDEVDQVLAEATSAGASVAKAAKDAFWGGYSGYFADPDGFLWEVAWNPGFPIADDGSISLPD